MRYQINIFTGELSASEIQVTRKGKRFLNTYAQEAVDREEYRSAWKAAHQAIPRQPKLTGLEGR